MKKNRRVKNGVSRGKDLPPYNFGRLFRQLSFLAVFLILSVLVFNYAKLIQTYRSLSIDSIQSGSGDLDFPDLSTDQQRLLLVIEKEEEGVDFIEHVFFFTYSEKTQQGLVIYIPGWVYLSSSSGDISVRNMRYAGDQIEEGSGKEYAIGQIERLLGLRVESYVWSSPKSSEIWFDDIAGAQASMDPEELLASMLSELRFTQFIFDIDLLVEYIDGLESDEKIFALRDLLSLFEERIGRSDNIFVDLSLDEASQVAADGGVRDRYYINESYLDLKIQENSEVFRSREIEREQAKIEIYNGSGIGGLAGQYQRSLKNEGLNVIRSSNSPVSYEKGVIYLSDRERFPNTLKFLQMTLPDRFEVVEGRSEFLTTGDLVVVIGADIADSQN